jgi:hypothetical protein
VGEFPSFEGVEPPDLPPDFEDWSWCHDEAPSWGSDSRRCQLYVFHPDERRRGVGMKFRYSLVSIDANGEITDTLALTDDWAEVLAALPPIQHPL